MSDVAVLPAVNAFLQREHGHYINGNSLPGQGPLRLVINPATAQTIAQGRDGGAGEVQAAMAAARQAFSGGWGTLPALARGSLLLKLADALEQHREELAQLETLCSG